MKKLIFIAVLGIFSFGHQLDAQQMKGRPEKGEMLERMQEKLQLTDNQVAQIKAIDAKYESREANLKAQMTKLKEEHKALRAEKKAEIDKVLTAEQREKINAWKDDRQSKRPRGGVRKMQK